MNSKEKQIKNLGILEMEATLGHPRGYRNNNQVVYVGDPNLAKKMEKFNKFTTYAFERKPTIVKIKSLKELNKEDLEKVLEIKLRFLNLEESYHSLEKERFYYLAEINDFLE